MIVYLVSSYYGMNTGKGGHYYSTMTICEEVSLTEEVLLVNIGDFPAPSLTKSKFNVIYLEHKLHNTTFVIKKLINLLDGKKAQAIHSFDKMSILFGRVLSFYYKIPLVCTKCGGEPYPKNKLYLPNYYPRVNIQTVFHAKDLEYFENLGFIKRLQSIPGRVKIQEGHHAVSEQIDQFYKGVDSKLMRICRISEFYYSTIIAMLHLLKLLLDQKSSARLVIIGHVSQDEYLLKVKKEIRELDLEENVLLLNDESHTLKASRFLHYANVVLGTGRSFMEAASCGHLMFAPVKASRHGALVSEQNVEEFECHNFSTRTPKSALNDFSLHQEEWLRNIQDKEFYTVYEQWIKKRFREVYSVEAACIKYKDLYEKADLFENSLLDLVRHCCIFHLSMIKFKLKKRLKELWYATKG